MWRPTWTPHSPSLDDGAGDCRRKRRKIVLRVLESDSDYPSYDPIVQAPLTPERCAAEDTLGRLLDFWVESDGVLRA
jgi:hypothetical protein